MDKREKQLDKAPAQNLFKTISKIKTPLEARKFLRDLCTLDEIETMAERWEVARLVDEGIPYREIAKKTGASTATVTRVAHWLHHGMDGYRFMLKRKR